ncbi:hypothetical protein GC163_00595 [bacterium]|nr:hypothetical protein [bacterium]
MILSAQNSSAIGASGSLPGAGRSAGDQELEKTFRTAVAGMFYGQLMKALRSTEGETAYIHGGQAEKMFQAQLDQQLVEDLAAGHDGDFVTELYQQFRRNQNLPTDPVPSQSLLPLQSASSGNASSAPASLQLTQVVEAASEARSVSQRILSTTDTSVFAGLFRK